jgi:hypothetical protein
MHRSFAAGMTILLSLSLPAAAAEMPKRGGTLTYMIPAGAPPSFDGHRENTFATIHAVAPFYSVLIRANPENPASTTQFVCDVCTEIPEPTDGGRTYAFAIRDDVKFEDGSALSANDVAASWNKIVAPPEGVISVRRGYYSMVDKVAAPDRRPWSSASNLRRLRFSRPSPILMPSSTKKRFSTATPIGSRRTSWAPARSVLRNISSGSRFPARAIPITIARDCRISTASSAFSPTSRQCG